MAVIKKKSAKDVEIVNSGDQITIPAKMSIDEAIDWLHKKKEADNKVVQWIEKLPGHPLDAAHALALAVKQIYGFTEKLSTYSFFGETPPRYISVPIDHLGTTTEVFVGKFKVPDIDGDFQTFGQEMELVVVANIRSKHKDKVQKLCTLAREMLQTNSLYRNKAITISYEEDPKTKNLEMLPPQFIAPYNGVRVRLNADLMASVEAEVWAPVVYSQAAREAGVSMRRGILLAGPFGVGKTLVARITADLCTKHEYTFLYCNTPEAIQNAFNFAKVLGTRTVIFCEDFEVIIKNNDQSKLQNMIDGVDTKNLDIILIFTTNYPEQIPPSLIRPGRIDSVIPFEAPDSATAELLVRDFAGDKLDPNQDLTSVGEALSGQIPAVIRCVVEKSTLHALRLSNGLKSSLTAEAILESARTMEKHVAMINKKQPRKLSAMEQLGEQVGRHIMQGISWAKSGEWVEDYQAQEYEDQLTRQE